MDYLVDQPELLKQLFLNEDRPALYIALNQSNRDLVELLIDKLINNPKLLKDCLLTGNEFTNTIFLLVKKGYTELLSKVLKSEAAQHFSEIDIHYIIAACIQFNDRESLNIIFNLERHIKYDKDLIKKAIVLTDAEFMKVFLDKYPSDKKSLEDLAAYINLATNYGNQGALQVMISKIKQHNPDLIKEYFFKGSF